MPLAFVPAAADPVLAQLVADWEEVTDRTLRPGDPERMLLQGVAYESARIRALINDAGNQNLLDFARGAHLDALATLVGVTRKTPVAASTVLRFFRGVGVVGAVEIPEGTQAAAGTVLFETTEGAEIADLDSFADVAAVAVEPGASRNAYVPGQVKTITGPLPGVARVENVTTTAGGRDTEGDDELRERVRGALALTTVAGPAGAYRARALAAHPDVADAAVVSPRPGTVRVVPVGRLDGAETIVLPDPVLAAVLDALSADTVRPLCDTVEVVAPSEVAATIALTWYGERERNAEMETVQAAVLAAVEGYRLWQTGGLGRDVIPSRLVAAVSAVPGVKRVTVAAPSVYVAVAPTAVVRVTSVDVDFGGVEGP